MQSLRRQGKDCGRQLRRPYSSQTRSPQSHSNARMTVCLSGKCTVLSNFSVAPQTRHSRLELPSVSPIFSALNISICHPRVLIPEFREKVVIVKLGHCENQIGPVFSFRYICTSDFCIKKCSIEQLKGISDRLRILSTLDW